MAEDKNNIDFFEFLDKLIEQCTNKLSELRMVSSLHKVTVKEIADASEGQSLADFEEIAIRQELHSLITISLLDLCVILRMFKTSQLTWERIFLIRKGYLTIYETIKAYEKQKNKIRNLITESGFSADEFLVINRKIKSFKKQFDYDKGISNIRNKTAGHFDENFDTFFDTVFEIEPSVGIEAIKELMTILSQIDKLLHTFREFLNKKIEERTVNLEIELNEKKKELRAKIEEFKSQKR
jgi:hypothetical protein